MREDSRASLAERSDVIRELLGRARTIAVVGLSPDPGRDSFRVARYLQARGYRIVPVNPTVAEVLGEKSYARLADVPVPIDIVNIFRRPEHIPAIVDEAIAAHAGAVWMQLGLADADAAEKARSAGLHVIMDKCLMVEHRAALGG